MTVPLHTHYVPCNSNALNHACCLKTYLPYPNENNNGIIQTVSHNIPLQPSFLFFVNIQHVLAT